MIEVPLSEDQKILRMTAAKFIEATCPLETVRELAESPTGIPDGYLRQIADLGWFSLLLPDPPATGIAEDGISHLALVSQERGCVVQPGPFIPMTVVIAAICRSGSASQRNEVLPALASGDQVATWVLGDGTGSWAPIPAVVARKDAGGFRLAGTALVQDASIADWFLVTANSVAGLSQFLVPASAHLRVEPVEAHDVGMRFATVWFDNLFVPESSLLGADGDATDDVEFQVRLANMMVVAETVGAMHTLFEMAREYSLTRVAFGRPIGSFQAVKHQLADLSLAVEASKAVSDSAVWAMEAGRDDAAEIVSMAKAWIGDAGIDVAQGCFQVFGGIGYAWEHNSHWYLRRITMNTLLYGAAEWHRERICSIHGL